jgi:hypothetical protein
VTMPHKKLTPPPGIDKLRRARDVVDPARVYRLQMPDGSIFSATGAELIETAEAAVGLVDAAESGNMARQRAALARFEADLDRMG